MRPITGTSPGNHVVIKCVIHAHGDRVGTSPAEQMSDIKQERRVTLAHMLSSEFSIYPDCGCVEYGLELDSYRKVLPFIRNVEGPPIPADTATVNKTGIHLQISTHPPFLPLTIGPLP